MNLELAFTVSADSSCTSYGIVLSGSGNGRSLNDLDHILVIEPEQNRLYLTDAKWEFGNCREYIFRDDMSYRFRMIVLGNTLELYINDELVFNSGIVSTGALRAGLFGNNGNLRITDLELFGLEN